MEMPRYFRMQINPTTKEIEAVPIFSEDVVEVVRCKNCKYNYGIANNCEYAKSDIVCTLWESDGFDETDFCSRGENFMKPYIEKKLDDFIEKVKEIRGEVDGF